jgi:hypothetical protein
MIPVVTRAAGTVSKSFRKYLEQHAGKARIQRTTENIHIGHGTQSRMY